MRAEEIVKALAAKFPGDQMGQCTAKDFGVCHGNDSGSEHDADCPYRMAVEWVETQDGIARGVAMAIEDKRNIEQGRDRAAGSVPSGRGYVPIAHTVGVLANGMVFVDSSPCPPGTHRINMATLTCSLCGQAEGKQ